MSRHVFVAALIASITSGAVAAKQHVWAIDLVKVNPGELQHYVLFAQRNWQAARETALRRHIISGYRMLVVNSPGAAQSNTPDVMLMTEYPSAGSYARREQLFSPIIKERPVVLVDGRTSRDFVQSITELSATTP